MPVEALNAVPALARRSAQRGLEAIQAAVAAKAVHKVAAVADSSFLGILDGELQASHLDGEPQLASMLS